jgi:uncharacterized peroxidase-related enzyme
MPRINAVENSQVDSDTQALFTRLAQKLGRTPNLVRTMAVAPAVLDAYLTFGRSMGRSSLSPKLREQIGLTVSELNRCQYCLAAHASFGKAAGLADEEIADSRKGSSPDQKTEAILQFARKIVTERGWVGDDDVQLVRAAGASDAEVAEIVAAVALNTFTNYFLQVADTEIDFPDVEPAGTLA